MEGLAAVNQLPVAMSSHAVDSFESMVKVLESRAEIHKKDVGVALNMLKMLKALVGDCREGVLAFLKVVLDNSSRVITVEDLYGL